jgi:hypothetical protein
MEPRLGRTLLLGIVFGCLDPILSICCALGYRDPFTIPLDVQGKKDYDRARTQLSNSSNSDHVAILNAVNGYLNLRSSSQEYGYCQGNFLSHSTMRMVKGMRQQVMSELQRLCLVSASSGGGGATWEFANRHSKSLAAVTTVLSCGRYPNIMRRRVGVKNFDAPGQRKCRLNGSSIPAMAGGVLNRVDANTKKGGMSRWITFGEMLKGMRAELVRDATVISPFSVLFGAGSAVEATSNKGDEVGAVSDEDQDDQDGEGGGGGEGGVSNSMTTVLSIDANLEFRIASELVEVTDTLRGCVHAAVALLVWKSEGRKDDGTLAAMDACVTRAVDTVIDVVTPDYR